MKAEFTAKFVDSLSQIFHLIFMVGNFKKLDILRKSIVLEFAIYFLFKMFFYFPYVVLKLSKDGIYFVKPLDICLFFGFRQIFICISKRFDAICLL